MDPGQFIPSPDTLPAPWGFFNLLLVVTFTLHLLLANSVLGGAVIALVRNSRRKWRQGEDTPAGELTGKLPLLLALAINMGVAPLLFLQVLYGQYIYTSAVLMAVFWVSMFLLIILAYYALYAYRLKFASLGEKRIYLLALAVGSLMLVSFFFTSSLLLMINPSLWGQYFANKAGTVLPWSESTLAPRYVHFFLASIAIGGLAQALWARWRDNQGASHTSDRLREGLIWYGAATLLQFPAGAWYLGALPGEVLVKVMTSEIRFVVYLFLSVVLGLASANFAFGGRLRPTVYCAVFTVFLMVLFRGGVRSAYLAPYLKPDEMPVSLQAGSLTMFLIVAAVGLLVVKYLLRLVVKSIRGASA